jgi:hypothetical protein
MGFFDRLLRSGAGSPKSIAENQLRIYRTYLAQNPKATKADALRYCIETRYHIMKIMKQGEIESCLAEADTLGHLVFLIVAKENPAAVSFHYLKDTVNDLYEVFERNAPEEIGALQKLKNIVSIR